jgi:hypothetical protein
MDSHLILERHAYLPHATIGRLHGFPFEPLWTMENPWKNNQTNVSCIPEGYYRCRKRVSPKFGETYEVLNVPDRSHILFHAGNRPRDTEGCILVGNKISEAQYAIVESRSALTRLFDFLGDEYEFRLTVRSYRAALDRVQNEVYA